MLNVAKAFTPTYTFAIADEDEFKRELEELGLGESALDVNVIVFGKDNKRYVMNPDQYDEFSEESFKEFMTDLNDGTCQWIGNALDFHSMVFGFRSCQAICQVATGTERRQRSCEDCGGIDL